MPRRKSGSRRHEVRGQKQEANSLQAIASQTAKLWRKHHLTYDQTKHVVEQNAPGARSGGAARAPSDGGTFGPRRGRTTDRNCLWPFRPARVPGEDVVLHRRSRERVRSDPGRRPALGTQSAVGLHCQCQGGKRRICPHSPCAGAGTAHPPWRTPGRLRLRKQPLRQIHHAIHTATG